MLRFDFDEFAQGVLQSPANGNRAPHGGVEIGKFFAGDAAGGIHARPGFVHDDVLQIGTRVGNKFRHELFGFPASRAVADGDQIGIDANCKKLRQFLLLRRFSFLGDIDVNHIVRHAMAEFIQSRQLAAGAKTRINRHHAAVSQRRLQQQIFQVFGEDGNRVDLGFVGQLFADFAFQTGQDQSRQGHRPRRFSKTRCDDVRIAGNTFQDSPAPARHRKEISPAASSADSPRLMANTRCGGILAMASS